MERGLYHGPRAVYIDHTLVVDEIVTAVHALAESERGVHNGKTAPPHCSRVGCVLCRDLGPGPVIRDGYDGLARTALVGMVSEFSPGARYENHPVWVRASQVIGEQVGAPCSASRSVVQTVAMGTRAYDQRGEVLEGMVMPPVITKSSRLERVPLRLGQLLHS